MIQHLASLPILLPMLTAVILLLPPCGKSVKIRRLVSIVMAIATFAISVFLLVHINN